MHTDARYIAYQLQSATAHQQVVAAEQDIIKYMRRYPADAATHLYLYDAMVRTRQAILIAKKIPVPVKHWHSLYGNQTDL